LFFAKPKPTAFFQKGKTKTKIKRGTTTYLHSLGRSVDDFDGFLRRHESRSGNGTLIGRSDASDPDAIRFMHAIGRRNNVQLNQIKPKEENVIKK
jgi:hypothetical protein